MDPFRTVYDRSDVTSKGKKSVHTRLYTDKSYYVGLVSVGMSTESDTIRVNGKELKSNWFKSCTEGSRDR